jgi:hypoxanthine phosphoribosyltransferase
MLSHKLNVPYIETIDKVNEDVIIIDDIADTGKTLKKYKSHPIAEKNYYVTIHEHEQSIIKPDYSVINKGDKWIVYPWETEESEEIQDYLK